MLLHTSFLRPFNLYKEEMKNGARIWHLIVGLFGVMIIILTIVFMMFSSMGIKPTSISKDIVITFMTCVTTLSAAIIAKDYKKRKDAENKPDLSEPNYDDLIGDIVGNIQERFGAYRCAYWVYTNGTYTGDDYSMQNCSMVVERNAEGVMEVIADMQMIPKVQFRRNITPLKEAPYHISYEDDYNDRLAHFNLACGIKTAIFFKCLNGSKWTGVLGVGFNESQYPIDEDDISWTLMQISRIEAIIRNIKKR